MSDMPFSLSEPEQLLQLLLDQVRDHAVFEVNEAGMVLSWNPSILRLFGYTPDDIVASDMVTFFPAAFRSPERVHDLLAVANTTGKFNDTLLLARKTGQHFNGQVVILRVSGVEPPRYAVVIRDLTMLTASQDQLFGLATLDQLTGLSNRLHFFDMGRVEYRRWRRYRVPMSMVLCDVDRLRELNDKFGIEAGDSILRDVSDLLRQSVREVDLVARLDGGTFGAILFSTPLEGACVMAERVRAAVSNTQFNHCGKIIRSSACLAVTTANEGVLDFDGFYQQSEEALFKVKHQGGDRIIVA